MSPVRAHRQRALAAALSASTASPATPLSSAAASEYELQRARLGVDLRRLKEIQSIEKKIELKRDLLPAYRDWIEGVLAADTGAQDDILVQMMIWTIDTGDFAAALPLCRYVVDNELDLPDRFDRTAPTLICEEIADAALKSIGQGETFDLAVLKAVDDMVEGEDIFDQVRAKLEKAMGLLLLAQGEAIAPGADGPAGAKRAVLENARLRLRRALELDPNAGVKKKLEQLDREIAKLGEPSSA
jgi:hypothetical protein